MKKILVINFFPAFTPPASGGELRYFNIYNELSKYFDVTLLSPTYSNHKFEVVTHSDTFREYRVPKENIHDTLHMNLDKEEICSEISALVCALSADYPNMYHYYYNELYKDTDIIIHESPYMLNYDIFFGLDNKPRIYNSYNVEYELVRQMWKGKNAKNYLEYIKNLEKKLVQGADLVFAISKEEQEMFVELFDCDRSKIRLAPNGIHPFSTKEQNEILFRSPNKESAFFIGSGHPPNIDAANFIINGLADKCPNIKFIIAGSCCDHIEKIKKTNVEIMGRIDEKTKLNLFRSSSIAINPMFSGSGTNLKTLEYLSAGLPLVSTLVGARGLDLEDQKHFIAAEREEFYLKLQELAGNLSICQTIAENGKKYVDANYSWFSISNNIKQYIYDIKYNPKVRNTIFLINDFGVAEPFGGGEIRINRLYSYLSKYYNIILLCFNDSNKISKQYITEHFVQISIPKTEKHQLEEKRINAMFWVSATDIVNSYMCVENKILMKVAENLHYSSDITIAIHPYMIKALNDMYGKPIIYESLNAEVDLKKDILKGHPEYDYLIKQVNIIEKVACEKSEFIISVSDDDHDKLNGMINSKKDILTIKNGVDIIEKTDIDYGYVKNLFHGRPLIYFIGSAHYPNLEAVKYIIEDLAPSTPELYYAIVGTVCDSFVDKVPANVLLFGKLDDKFKDFLLKISDIAINPMISGSGSNLKLAEYFANKLPVVSTLVGTRGYEVEDGKEAIICELKDFKKKINDILSNHELKNKISKNSFAYATRELSWEVLAKKFKDILDNRILDKKRLLVITYRFTNPPLGGAETYMLNVLKEIDKLGRFSIDIATLNIYDIQNQFHFSTNYSINNEKEVENSGMHVYKFNTDKMSVTEKYENCKQLYVQWVNESIEISIKNIHKYTLPLLMGGWYYPETSSNGYEIWSSNKSLIYVDSVKNISIKGYSPKKRKLDIKLDETNIFNENVYGDFDICLECLGGKVLELEIEPFYVKNEDPRALGIKIKEIQCDGESFIMLNHDYKAFLKQNYLDKYIEQLINNANSRNTEIDNLFQSTRGPVSSELEEWLSKNIDNYDVVLGHSVPFATSVIAQRYSEKYNKPVVLLPHFHIDDEFYYWKSYFDAMSKADRVIISPKASKELFYDKINVNSVHISGGAIYREEYENIDSNKFKEKYNSELPFFLVLGRKAGAKNYKTIIEAVRRINKKRKICNLVMIGKDEDGEIVDANDVIYFGEQSREVVLGALKECYGLITMSESESFGIVILEAWMQKKPVIINSGCPAFVELVDDNINGLHASQENLTEKIQFLLENRKEADILGENGYKIVEDRYTWKAASKKIDELLMSMCK